MRLHPARWAAACLAVALLPMGVPAGSVHPAEQPAVAVVHDRVVGRSPLLVGANPGLTTAPNWEAWVRDSRMNAAREWANMEEIEPENEDGTYGDGVVDEESFQAARAAVLAAPEDNPYLSWPGFRFRDVDRRVGAYDRLGITPIVVIRHAGSGSTREANLPPWMANVPRMWADQWEWWEYAFAVAYHAAREHGTTRYAIHSEPDRSVQGFTGRVEDYARLLSLGADAARTGVRAGLAARGGAPLEATIYGPGLAEPTARRGSYLQSVLTDAAGDLAVVDYHQYGSSLSGEYANRAGEVRSVVERAGVTRPLFVSEYNISRSGERGDVDDPSDALALAEAQRQLALAGVEGMLLYRFNFPAEFRNLSVIRSGPGSGRALVDETFGYQVFKQAATALAGGKDLLALDETGRATWLATRDAGRVYLLNVYRGGDDLPVDLDLTELGVEGSPSVVRVAAAGQPNDVLAQSTVQAGRLSFIQPPMSAVMVAIERRASALTPVSFRLVVESDELQRYRVGQVTALATFPDGSERDVSDLVRWSSSDPATLSVNSTGLAMALSVGEAALTACWVDVCAAPVGITVR